MNEQVGKVNALTQEQRDAAYDAARRRIAGRQPEQSDYERSAFMRYPPELVRAINRMADLVMLAAFVPSALRIFFAGAVTFYAGIPHVHLGVIVGLASVMLAEIGQVVFTLARATADKGRGQLGLGAVICTVYALVGNAFIARPWEHGLDIFALLEAFAPPILVLIAAHVRKTQSLNAIEDRWTAQRKYEEDMRSWADDYENAHLNQRWMHYLANALRDALRQANRRSTAVLRSLSDDDWRTLILREINAEQWYERTEARIQEEERRRTEADARTHSRTGGSGGARTGETDGAVHENADGLYVGKCPHCGEVFVRDTYKGATNALSAHVGRWCKVRNAPPSVNGATEEISARAEF